MVWVPDGVFDEVTDADPEVVKVVLDEDDMDALDVPELVLDDVDDAEVVEDADDVLAALTVAEEQAVDVMESVEVEESVMLFVAVEDPDTVDDISRGLSRLYADDQQPHPDWQSR